MQLLTKKHCQNIVRVILILLVTWSSVSHGYEDILSSSRISLVDSQLNSSSWAASNLLDSNAATRWLSAKQTNDLNFQLNESGEDVCIAGFDLTNYGNDDRSVRQFMLLTTIDSGLSADKGTAGWRPIIADANPTGKIDYLSWAQGARSVAIDSQLNSTSWAAKYINDGSTSSRWLSSKSNNVIEYNFDTDWNGVTGDSIPISEIEVLNYGVDDRSVKEFQLEVTTDGNIWRKLEVPGSAAGDLEYIYTRRQDGGILTNINSQLNSTSWGADNMQDGDLNTRWLSSKGNNVIEFAFDPNNDGITSAGGDNTDVFTMDKFIIENYGVDDRSVNEFQIAVKTQANPSWQKIRVPNAVIGQPDYNFAMSHHGGKLVVINSQLNTTSWAAANIHDGDPNTRWLSGKGNNSLEFRFDVDEDGTTATASDLFSFNQFFLQNYGVDDRSIKEFQIAVKTLSNPNWQKINVPGSTAGQADYNFALAHHGGQLVTINSQLNTTSWAGANLHDGDQNTRWLSAKGNNNLDFQFDLNDDGVKGGVADQFTLERFYLANYGNDDRAIKHFQIEIKTAVNSNWTKLQVPGTTAGDANYNYSLAAHGGSLTTIDSEHNSNSWAAKNIHDGDQNSRWLSNKQTNTLAFAFDTNSDGSTGDSVNIDTVELINYGNDDRSIHTFEIDIQINGGPWQAVNAPSGGTIFTANMNSSGQSWSLGLFTNVTATRIRTLTNYGDPSYTGARELSFSGNSIGPSYTFTAAMHGNGETFNVDASQVAEQVTDVRLRTINNYGDPSYTGAKELKLLGPSVTESKTFTAAMHGIGETFTLDANDVPVDVTDVKLITISNHGDPSYTGAKEFKLLGASVTETKTFEAAMQKGAQIFELNSDDIPVDVTGVKLITINNHGDPSYTGLQEFEVIGKSVTPSHTFSLPMTNTPYKIILDNDDQVTNITGVRLVTIKNHGDPSYTGLTEFKLYGQAITPSYIFEAAMNTSTQGFNFAATTANIFRFHSLNNHGDPSYTGAADFALNTGVCAAAQWRMNESSWSGNADEVVDSSNSGYDGVAVGFDNGDDPHTEVVSPAISGDPGTCHYGQFDGGDDYIWIPDGENLDNLTQLTLSAWIKADSFSQANGSGARGILSKGPDVGDNVTYGLFFSDTGGNQLQVDIDGANDRFSSNTSFTLGDWYHIALVFDGNQAPSQRVKLYVNGVLDGTFSESSAAIPDSAGDFYIGNLYSAVNAKKVFAGAIDEVNVKPVALQPSEITALMNLTSPCLEPIHHLQITHDGQGLTCSPETLTVKACANEDCSIVMASDVDVTLSASGASSTWSQNPVTIPSGSSAGIEVNLGHTTAETVTLSALSTPAAINPLVCDPDCQLNFADSGYLLTLENHQSCTSPSLTIEAVKLSDTGVSCAPAYTGQQSLDFIFNYDNPNTGTKVPTLASTPMAAATVVQNREVNFDATGKAILSFNYQDAGKIRLDVSDAGSKGLASSSVTTVVKPAKLIIATPEANSSCALDTADGCTAFKAAGESFSMNISAVCNDNTTITPNFVMANIPLTINTVAPNLGNPVTLGVNSFSFDNGDNGMHTIADQTVSEVGIFEITVTPTSYFGETITATTSESIGRFIPNHFLLNTVYEGTFKGGNPFVYNGQITNDTPAKGAISYEIEPEFTITATSALNTTTKNYTGSFLTLTAEDVLRVTPVTDTSQKGADELNKVILSANLEPVSLEESAGVITYTFNNEDHFVYDRNVNALIKPFTADIDLQIIAISDDDGVSAIDKDADATNGVITLQPVGQEIRFGRWNIDNSFGPETSDLLMSMNIEFWDGNQFVTQNDAYIADNITAIDTSNAIITDISLAPGTTDVSTSNGTGSDVFKNGMSNLVLSSPGANNQGEIQLEFTVPEWLKYDWNKIDESSDGKPYDDNPSAIATFGLFRGNDRIISWREVGN
jgi:MSHA biogenesis protein MshQ